MAGSANNNPSVDSDKGPVAIRGEFVRKGNSFKFIGKKDGEFSICIGETLKTHRLHREEMQSALFHPLSIYQTEQDKE